MKILLCEDVEKLGWLGDVVEVATGYARNYLIPQRLGKVPTQAAIKGLAIEKAKRSESRLVGRRRLEKAAFAVEGAEAVVAAKANEHGVLFGSVTEHEIAANLREQGFEVTDKVVQLDEHIKQVGTEQIELKFSSELTVKITVTVVAEGVPARRETPHTDDEDKDGQTDQDS